MYTTAKCATRFAGLTFAVLTAVAVNGAMLLKFDGVATGAHAAQNMQTHHVAVLDTVTIVGHRI